MNILCIIPARGGSKRLKNKNIIPLFGKPIIGYTILSALKSRLINKIVVSTDDSKIEKVSRKYGIQVIKRPKEYAADTSPIEQALRHAVNYLEEKEKYSTDLVVWLQANVPVRKDGQIDNVLMKLISSGVDSVVTVYRVSQYPLWMKKMDNRGFIFPLSSGVKEYRSQDVKPLYLLDGSIVAMRRQPLMETEGKLGAHIYLGKKTIGIIQEKRYTIEIDDREDLNLAKFYLQSKNADR